MSSDGRESTALNPFTKTSSANILQRALRKVVPNLITPTEKENSPHKHNSPVKKAPSVSPSIDLPPIRLYINQIQCKVTFQSIHQSFKDSDISIHPQVIQTLQKEAKEVSRMNGVFVRSIQVDNQQILSKMRGKIKNVMLPQGLMSRLKMGLYFYRKESVRKDFQPILIGHPYREYIKLASSKLQIDEYIAYYGVDFSLNHAKNTQKPKAIWETGAAQSAIPEKELLNLVSNFLETDRLNLLSIYSLALSSQLPSSLNLLTLQEEYHILESLAEAEQREKQKCVEVIRRYWQKADQNERNDRLGKVVAKLANALPHPELNKLQAEHYMSQPEREEYFLGGFKPLRDYFLLGKPVDYEDALKQVNLITSLCENWNPHVIGAITKAKPENQMEIEFVYTVLLKLQVSLGGAVHEKWLRGCLNTARPAILSSMYANLQKKTPMDGSLPVALLKKCMKDLHCILSEKDGSITLLRLFDLVIQKYVEVGNMEELQIKISFIVMALEGGEESTLLKYLLRFLSLSPANSSLRGSIHQRIRKVLSKDSRISLLKDYDKCLRDVAIGREVVEHMKYLQKKGEELTHYWIGNMRQWANVQSSNYKLQDVMETLLLVSNKDSEGILSLLRAIKPNMLREYPCSSDAFKKLFFSLLLVYRKSIADLCQYVASQPTFCMIILKCLPAPMGFLLISYLQESNPNLPPEITLLIEKQINNPAETNTQLAAYAKEIVRDPLLPTLCTISFKQDLNLFHLLLDHGAISAMSASVAHSHELQSYTNFILALNQQKQGKLPGDSYYQLQRLLMSRLLEQIDTPAKAETALKIAIYATNTIPLSNHIRLLPEIYRHQLMCPNLGRLLVYVLCMYIAKGQFETVQLEWFTRIAHMLVLKSPAEPSYSFFINKLMKLLETLPSLPHSLKHILIRMRDQQPKKSIAAESGLNGILEGTVLKKNELQATINRTLESVAVCNDVHEAISFLDDLMAFIGKNRQSSALKYLEINTPGSVILKNMQAKVKFMNVLRLILERCDEETQGVPQKICKLLDILCSADTGVSNLDRVVDLTAFLKLVVCVAKQRILFTHQLNRCLQINNVVDKARLLLLNRTDALINGTHSHYDQFERTLDSIIFQEQMLMSRQLSLLKLLELHEKTHLIIQLLYCTRHLQFPVTVIDPIIVILRYVKMHLRKHRNSPSQLVEFVRFKSDYFHKFSMDTLLESCRSIEALLEQLNLPMTQQEHRAYDKYVQLM